MRSERIEDIKKRFKKEWLLIAVTESNKETSTSTKGKLLAHSPLRDEIYKKLIKIKVKYPFLVDYTGNAFAKGTIAAF